MKDLYNRKNKFYFKILFINILFILFFTIATNFIFEKYDNSLENNYKKEPLIYFLFIGFISPIIEEFIFRFPLKFNNKNIFIIPIILLFIFISDFLIAKFFFLLFFICLIIQLITEKNVKIIYFLSIICFGIIHLDNYNSINDSIIENIVLIFPQLLLGTILTFIRMHENIKSSILYHSIYNFIILLISIVVNGIS